MPNEAMVVGQNYGTSNYKNSLTNADWILLFVTFRLEQVNGVKWNIAWFYSSRKIGKDDLNLTWQLSLN
jgi:hypothetical protein